MSEHHANVIIGGGPAGLNLAIRIPEAGNRPSAPGRPGEKRRRTMGPPAGLRSAHLPEQENTFRATNHTYKMRYDWHTLSSISAEDAARDPRLVCYRMDLPNTGRPRGPTRHICSNVAREMGLTASIRTGAHVQRISRPDGRFRLEIAGLGPETCTFYQDFDAEAAAERYRNKIVIVNRPRQFGLRDRPSPRRHHRREPGWVTRSLPEFARQSHNVHDIRAQVAGRLRSHAAEIQQQHRQATASPRSAGSRRVPIAAAFASGTRRPARIGRRPAGCAAPASSTTSSSAAASTTPWPPSSTERPSTRRRTTAANTAC